MLEVDTVAFVVFLPLSDVQSHCSLSTAVFCQGSLFFVTKCMWVHTESSNQDSKKQKRERKKR